MWTTDRFICNSVLPWRQMKVRSHTTLSLFSNIQWLECLHPWCPVPFFSYRTQRFWRKKTTRRQRCWASWFLCITILPDESLFHGVLFTRWPCDALIGTSTALCIKVLFCRFLPARRVTVLFLSVSNTSCTHCDCANHMKVSYTEFTCSFCVNTRWWVPR